jgi:toxin FitB
MLIDSNIIIYSAQPSYADLRRFIASHAPAVSAINYVEVFGDHRLMEQHRPYYRHAYGAAAIGAAREETREAADDTREGQRAAINFQRGS